MPDPTPRPVTAEWFYSTIVGAVAQRASTAEVWDSIRAFAKQTNTAIPSSMFAEVNRLRGNAAGVRNASEALQRAAPGDTLTGDVIGHPIYARPQGEFQALPQWEARIRMTLEGPGGTREQWATVRFGMDRPDTVEALLAELDSYAADLAAAYETVMVGWGSPQINQV